MSDIPVSIEEICLPSFSQIMAGDQRYMKQLVETEIQRVNTLQKQWKIRINTAKFKVVALDSRKLETLFYTKFIKIEGSSTSRFLGLNLDQQGCSPSAPQMAAVGKRVLPKVSCLSGLSKGGKKTISLALVRSRKAFSFSPWMAMTHPQILTLQAVQTHGVDVIDNHKWYERLTQKRQV